MRSGTSAASLLAAQGLSLRSVAEVLGHAQISTTAALYTHVFETAQREAAAAMDGRSVEVESQRCVEPPRKLLGSNRG